MKLFLGALALFLSLDVMAQDYYSGRVTYTYRDSDGNPISKAEYDRQLAEYHRSKADFDFKASLPGATVRNGVVTYSPSELRRARGYGDYDSSTETRNYYGRTNSTSNYYGDTNFTNNYYGRTNGTLNLYGDSNLTVNVRGNGNVTVNGGNVTHNRRRR